MPPALLGSRVGAQRSAEPPALAMGDFAGETASPQSVAAGRREPAQKFSAAIAAYPTAAGGPKTLLAGGQVQRT